MKKIGKILKNNIRYLIAFVIGFLVVSGGAYAAIVIQGTKVSLSSSGLSSTDVQHAIDELYQKKQAAATSPIPDTALKLGDYFN